MLNLTQKQIEIKEMIISTDENVLIDCTAGAGKTFLINLVSKELAQSGNTQTMGLSFSNIGVSQLRNFDYTWTTTKLGYALLLNYFWSYDNKKMRRKAYKNNSKFNKYNYLLNAELKRRGYDQRERAAIKQSGIRNLIDIARLTLAESDSEWNYAWQISSGNDNLPPEYKQIVENILEDGILKFQRNKTIDYIDCIWLPNIIDMELTGRYYVGKNYRMIPDPEDLTIFVDEYQDMSKAEIKVLGQFADQGARIVLIGDSQQAIYGWRGALGNARELCSNLFEDLQHFTMNTSFRCPASHTEYIRRETGYDIVSYEKNGEGELIELNSLDEALKYIIPGETLITSRNINGKDSPILPAIGYILAKTDYTIRLEGFNFEQLTKKLLTKMAELDCDINDVDYVAEQVISDEEFKVSEEPNYFVDFKELRKELKFAVTVVRLCTEAVTADEIASEIREKLNNPNADVLFSTVFRIKGKEFESVLYLDPEVKENENNPEEINKQEHNIKFVGLSRSRNTLVLVSNNK